MPCFRKTKPKYGGVPSFPNLLHRQPARTAASSRIVNHGHAEAPGHFQPEVVPRDTRRSTMAHALGNVKAEGGVE